VDFIQFREGIKLAKNPNNDSKTVKRVGKLNANNMTIEYWDKDTEKTSIYKINTPFFEYHDQEVEVTISFKVIAKEEKVIDHKGEILVDNEE
jgi:hypothetical protein